MKLSTQMLLYFTVCICALFTLQTLIVNTQTYELQSSQTDRLNSQLVQSAANEIGAQLNQRLSEMRLISHAPQLRSENREEIISYLLSLNSHTRESYGELVYPFVFSDAEGNLFLENGMELSIAQREFFRQAFASQKEYTLSKPLISRLEWQRVIILTYPIYSDSGERQGYLLGSLSLDLLNEVLSDIDIYDSVVWIMDSEGRVLAEDDNHEHSSINSLCPKSFNLTRTASALHDSSNGKTDIALGDTEDGLLLYAALPYTPDWKLCIFTSRSVVYASLDQVRNIALFTWSAMLVSALLFSLICVHHLTNPLKKLSCAMDRFDPNAPLPPLPATSALEIRQLSNSFSHMHDHIRQLIQQLQQEEKQKQQAELRALQAQINPHFLYNTLDTIAWKAMDHNATEVSDMITALSRFFQLSLSDGNDFVSLNDELEHAYHYLFIQQIRYSDRLDYTLEMDPELGECRVPKLILQPLIENALYHGIKPLRRRGEITVRIESSEQFLLLTVSDNGVGLLPERCAHLNHSLQTKDSSCGYGLYNIAERLRLTYGSSACLQLKSAPDHGTIVSIQIPREENLHESQIADCR